MFSLKKNIYIFIFISLGIVFSFAVKPELAHAAAFTITPQVFDEQVHGRDIVKDHVTIKNISSRTLFVFVDVNDISNAAKNKPVLDPSLTDRSDSLASWVWISRSLQLLPGETKTLDLRIQVNLNAKPGTYHARLSFAEGNTQAEAESNKSNGLTADLNVTVQDNNLEQLDLLNFVADHSVFLKSQASFSYSIKNSGNIPLSPAGEISLYNRGGQEVATLPVNKEGNTIAPGDTATLHTLWQPAPGLGRYKAILRLKYGEKQPQILTDVAFFTLLPWPLLLALIGILFLLVFTLLYLVNRHEAQRRVEHQAQLEQLLILANKNRRKRTSAKPSKPLKQNSKQ